MCEEREEERDRLPLHFTLLIPAVACPRRGLRVAKADPRKHSPIARQRGEESSNQALPN